MDVLRDWLDKENSVGPLFWAVAVSVESYKLCTVHMQSSLGRICTGTRPLNKFYTNLGRIAILSLIPLSGCASQCLTPEDIREVQKAVAEAQAYCEINPCGPPQSI